MFQNNFTSDLPDLASLRSVPIDWTKVTGPVDIPMTNDYLFRAVLQMENEILKALICSLLHLDPQNVTSVEVTNPIILGTSINAKDFILDIQVLLNNSSIINLELQVINQHNWPERSLSYLCRSFDNLNKGSDYKDVKPVVQIGILDFTLFPEHPEFYSTYWMMNEKTHQIYSDKLRLSVVDLTQIHISSEEDKYYHIDMWAAFFKAKTWEELKMLASMDKIIEQANAAYYRLSKEERIRQQCEARAEYYRMEKTRQREQEEMKKMQEENQKMLEEIRKKQDETRKMQDATFARIDRLFTRLKKSEKELSALGINLDELMAEIVDEE